MSVLARSIAAVVVSSLAMVAGCAAPVGDPPAGDPAAPSAGHEEVTKDALVAGAPGLRLFTKPTYYTAFQGVNVDMGPAANQVCTLTGVNGGIQGFHDQSSTAFIWVLNGHYWLEVNNIEFATAVCAPWSDFSGPGTSSHSSTAASPWYTEAGYQFGYTSSSTVDMGPTTAGSYCLLSGLAGNWSSGSPWSNSVQIESNIGETTSGSWQLSNVMKLSTAGPFARANANCLSFGVSSLATASAAAVSGTPATLPPVSQAFCGILSIVGSIDNEYDSVQYWADGDNQGFGLTGNDLEQVTFGCIDYVQPY